FFSLFFLLIFLPPTLSLFPYTTLFRSILLNLKVPFAYRSGAKTARSSSERLHKQEKRRRLTIRQSEKQTNTLSLILNWRRGGRTKFVCILPILAIRLLA